MAVNNNENSNECHQRNDTFGSAQIRTLRKVIPVNQHGLKSLWYGFKLYSKDVKDLQHLVILQLIKKKKKLDQGSTGYPN